MTRRWPLPALALALALAATPLQAQDDGAEYIVVTASKRTSAGPLVIPDPRPIIGLRRQADSALRRLEITSDSLDEDVRRKEVEAMLLAALDRATKDGITLVTGEFEVIEVTRSNWAELFPALSGKIDDADEDDDDDEDDGDDESGKAAVRFEDDGNTATLRLMAKTPLSGSIAEAQRRIAQFARGVPANGRSQLHQRGTLSLTIVKPEQYRDEIYRRIAQGAQHASGFYGEGYGVELTGLDREIAWAQVSNTEVFLYIPYRFTVRK